MSNVKLILMRVLALNVVVKITDYKILMEIVMDNAYVNRVIMMIIKKINVNNALFNFGFFINNLYNNT